MVSRKVLVVGEALIDVVDGEEVVGGSPANVALGLGRLGVEVSLLTAIGRDDRGRKIAEHLEAAGVVVLPESFCLQRTSTARATLKADGSAKYEFDVAWPPLPEVLVDFDVLHVGSIACFLPPGADAVLELVKGARERGAWVTFDPNIRPSLVDVASAAERSLELMALSNVVKMSDEDAESVFSHSNELVAANALALGPQLVAVTRGGAGAGIYTASHASEVTPQATHVVDTVGAGDTFMAALIAWIVEGRDLAFTSAELEQLGRFCAVAAAITVSRTGADLPTRAEVLALL